MDHLCRLVTKSVQSFSKYHFHKFGNRRTDAQKNGQLPTATPVRRLLIASVKEMTSNCLVQEAQLSQRDRATLRVIEDFAKSLMVTEASKQASIFICPINKQRHIISMNNIQGQAEGHSK